MKYKCEKCRDSRCELDGWGNKNIYKGCPDCSPDNPEIKPIDGHVWSDNNIQSVEHEGKNVVIYSTENVNSLSVDDLMVIANAKGFVLVKA